MNDNETNQLINEMISHAQDSYNRTLCNFYQNKSNLPVEILECFNNSDFMDKKMALEICNGLVTLCLASGKMEVGSLIHIFGLRLYEYIDRKID